MGDLGLTSVVASVQGLLHILEQAQEEDGQIEVPLPRLPKISRYHSSNPSNNSKSLFHHLLPHLELFMVG
jgi:hypothetical protein